MQDTTTARLLAHKPQIQRPLRLLTWALLALGLVVAAWPSMPEVNISHADKYMHMLAFFGFAFLLDISERYPQLLALQSTHFIRLRCVN